MSEIILSVHSLIPYVLILVLLASVITAMTTLNSGGFGSRQLAIARVGLILAHVQLLIGILLLFFSDSVTAAFQLGMGEIMKTEELRMKIVEHPLMMLIAIVLFTIGSAKAKRADSAKGKSKSILIFYGIGLVLVLSRIPYSAWFNL